MINRRSILTSILAALASGASASAQILDHAAKRSAASDIVTQTARKTVRITRTMLNDPVIGRYAKTLQLQQELYIANDRYTAFRKANPGLTYKEYQLSGSGLLQAIWDKGDELIAYMLANFEYEHTLENEYLTDDVFQRRIICDVLSIQGLAAILDVVLPVAVLKHALSVEKVAFDTVKMTQFGEFADRFRDTILGRSRPIEQIKVMYPGWRYSRWAA